MLVGDIGSERWSENLWESVGEAGCSIDWYDGGRSHLSESNERLTTYGIHVKKHLSESDFAEVLTDYRFAIVPTGTLDEHDDRSAAGRYGLPNEIVSIAVASQLPIIVLGSPDTAAARFVRRLGIGVSCGYDGAELRKAILQVSDPDKSAEIRANAERIAPTLCVERFHRWLWSFLELGLPRDNRFEDLLPRLESDPSIFIEPPAPKLVFRSFAPAYQVALRLFGSGYRPDFIVDVGASTGVWSFAVSQVFKESRFVLVDPIFGRYDEQARKYHVQHLKKVQWEEAAVSNQVGRQTLQVTPDLYGSSLLDPSGPGGHKPVKVAVVTLDELSNRLSIEGRGVLKVDARGAEHLVLEGAQQFISHVDVLFIKLSLVRSDSSIETWSDMVEMARTLGFRPYDVAGEERSPLNGELLSQYLVFIRYGL